MKRKHLKAASAQAVILTSLTFGMAASAQETHKKTDRREDYAYSPDVFLDGAVPHISRIQMGWQVRPKSLFESIQNGE